MPTYDVFWPFLEGSELRMIFGHRDRSWAVPGVPNQPVPAFELVLRQCLAALEQPEFFESIQIPQLALGGLLVCCLGEGDVLRLSR